jgi:hypothetical protein
MWHWKMLAFLAALARGMVAVTYQEFVLKCLLIVQLGYQLQHLPHLLLLFQLTSLGHLHNLSCRFFLVSDLLCLVSLSMPNHVLRRALRVG